MTEEGNFSTLNTAKRYVLSGISIIPVKLDGSKRPALRSWNEYRERFATVNELIAWYFRPWHGIAIVCGVQSGGLEVIDFDYGAEQNFDAFCRLIPPELYGRLCVVQTGGGGYHVIYRSSQVSASCKIAMTNDEKPLTLIESRGQGAYIVAVGSPARVHKSGRPYRQILGPPLPQVPFITPEERKTLWQAAATLDQRDAKAVRDAYIEQRVRELRAENRKPLDCSKPWDDFDRQADEAVWRAILEPCGWTTRDGIKWLRPGKHGGGSARLNRNAQGILVLTVFSGNAGALSPRLKDRESWGPYRAYKLLYFNNDGSAAAKAVRAMGFGGRS